MPRYTVEVKEVHTVFIEVEATSKKAAKAEVIELLLQNDYCDSHYDYTLDDEHWNVYTA